MDHQARTKSPSLLEAFLALVFLAGICVVSYSIYDKVTRQPRSETVCFQFSTAELRR